MPDSLIEELPRDVSRLASLVLHSAGKQPRLRRLTAVLTNRWFNGYAGHDPPGRAAVCGWGSSLVPGGWDDEPRLAGMAALLSQMTFGAINLSL